MSGSESCAGIRGQDGELGGPARLGEGGFDSPQAAGAFIILLTQTRAPAGEGFQLRGVDASAQKGAQEKAVLKIIHASELHLPELLNTDDVDVASLVLVTSPSE